MGQDVYFGLCLRATRRIVDVRDEKALDTLTKAVECVAAPGAHALACEFRPHIHIDVRTIDYIGVTPSAVPKRPFVGPVSCHHGDAIRAF